MPKKRMGRPRVIEPGASQNVYLPLKHIDYVDALAARNYLSFSAAVRLIVEADMRANDDKPRMLA